jgi:hypothetical protein
MTPELEEALGLWESGQLSRDELARRFPDQDVAGLLDAFDGMSAATAGPTPDAALAWAAVRTRLPARLADRRRGRGKAIRLLAAALIAVLVLGASAYAVVPSVRRAVNDAAGAITHDDDDRSDAIDPSESDGIADDPTPNVSDGVGSTTDPDEGAAGGNDANADADDHEADDPNAGSGSGSNEDAIEDGSGSGTDDGSIGAGSGSDQEDPHDAGSESANGGSGDSEG